MVISAPGGRIEARKSIVIIYGTIAPSLSACQRWGVCPVLFDVDLTKHEVERIHHWPLQTVEPDPEPRKESMTQCPVYSLSSSPLSQPLCLLDLALFCDLLISTVIP